MPSRITENENVDIDIVPLNQIDDQKALIMFTWLQDPVYRSFVNVCKGPHDLPRYSNWQELQTDLNASKAHRYGIMLRDEFVGEFNFVFDHPALLRREPKSAWIGIGIGDVRARGKEIGEKVMRFLESEISKAGGERIELGVFEINKIAISFYEKLNYQHFETIPQFTWFAGSWWADRRYEKYISRKHL